MRAQARPVIWGSANTRHSEAMPSNMAESQITPFQTRHKNERAEGSLSADQRGRS